MRFIMNSNHFDSEINQFNSQASFWWDADGPFKTLHQINPTRLAYIQQFTELKGKKVLDVGCGGGILSEAMAAKGSDVTGLDLAEDSLKIAKLHLYESELKVDYRLQSIEAHAAEHAERYDVVTCLEMLEHVPDPEAIIDACLAALKPGGWLILSTLNRTPKAMMLGIVAAEHVLRIVPKGTHHYAQFIKPSEMVAALKTKAVDIKDLSGMRYNPFSGTATLDKQDLDINYFVTIQKMTVQKHSAS